MFQSPTPACCGNSCKHCKLKTSGPWAAELRAERERQAEFKRQHDEADEHVAVYEAGLRAQAVRNKEKSDDAG